MPQPSFSPLRQSEDDDDDIITRSKNSDDVQQDDEEAWSVHDEYEEEGVDGDDDDVHVHVLPSSYGNHHGSQRQVRVRKFHTVQRQRCTHRALLCRGAATAVLLLLIGAAVFTGSLPFLRRFRNNINNNHVALPVDSSSSSSSGNPSSSSSPPQQTGLLPHPKEDVLARFCLAEDEESLTECANACEPSQCCHIPNHIQGSCVDAYPEDCALYKKHCAILEHYTGNAPTLLPDDDYTADDFVATAEAIPDASPDIDSICSNEHMSDISGMRECAVLCSPTRCCWDPIASFNCGSIQPKCAAYVQPCTNFDKKLSEP